MTPDNRLHKILGFIIEQCKTMPPDEYMFQYDDLLPALKNTNVYVIVHLCKVLEADRIINIDEDEEYVWLDSEDLNKAKEAYHAEAYKQKISFWELSLNLSSVLNGLSTVGVFVLALRSFSLQNQELMKMKNS